MSHPPTIVVADTDLHPAQAMNAISDSLTLLPTGAHDLLQTQCRARGIPTDGTSVVLGPRSMLHWANCVRELGGSWRTLPGGNEWSFSTWLVTSEAHKWLEEGFDDLILSKELGYTVLDHQCGFMEIELDGQKFLIAAYRMPPRNPQFWPEPQNVCVLGGQDAGAQRTLLRRFLRLEHEGGKITFWHGTGGRLEIPPVPEDEVILPPGIKTPLLAWIDHFSRQQGAARSLGVPLHRGLLLLGAPGTGKTQLVRHILSRYPERDGHLFVATAAGRESDSFSRMLQAVGAPGRLKIVVLEDIDLLHAGGGIPQAHLLNALDGLLRVETSVLWIATSNDPGALALNLLDRPGRFDRVVVLPEPGREEREAMVRLFSRCQTAEEIVRAAADASDGFTGAHLREACTSAALAQLSDGGEYGALLLGEIHRMAQQHSEAQSYFRDVSGRRVGFAPARNGDGLKGS